MSSVAVGSIGELLVEFVCAERDSHNRRPASYSGPFPSGAPGIFIDQAARIGARTIFAGAVGTDAFGDVLLERLRTAGVALDLVRRIADRPTGTAMVAYNGDGSRDFVFNIAQSAAPLFGDAGAIRGVGVMRRQAGVYDQSAHYSSGAELRDSPDSYDTDQTSARLLASWNATDRLSVSAFYFDQKTRVELARP